MTGASSPDLHATPASGDGRPSISKVLGAFEVLEASGWQVREVAAQPAPTQGTLPIRAWFNRPDVDTIFLGGIHGREPAGALALARTAAELVALGTGRGILVMPLLNPWGYLRHERYGPSGRSVTDSDHALGRAAAPASAEAAAILEFIQHGVSIRPGAAVLDLHEDPVYESPGYRFEGFGSYLYLSGAGACESPAANRVIQCLGASTLPLIRSGTTRFGDRIEAGLIGEVEDGSIDEFLARRLQCSPVITVENLLQAPDSPPLERRVDAYVQVIRAFVAAGPAAPR